MNRCKKRISPLIYVDLPTHLQETILVVVKAQSQIAKNEKSSTSKEKLDLHPVLFGSSFVSS